MGASKPANLHLMNPAHSSRPLLVVFAVPFTTESVCRACVCLVYSSLCSNWENALSGAATILYGWLPHPAVQAVLHTIYHTQPSQCLLSCQPCSIPLLCCPLPVQATFAIVRLLPLSRHQLSARAAAAGTGAAAAAGWGGRVQQQQQQQCFTGPHGWNEQPSDPV
jgi:hypothetical protein